MIEHWAELSRTVISHIIVVWNDACGTKILFIIYVNVQSLVSASGQSVIEETSTLEQLQQVKRKNKDLYEFAVNKILKS